MRNDYIGYGILKDIAKYRKRLINVMIKDSMTIEERTLIRIKVSSLNYNDLIKKLKELKA